MRGNVFNVPMLFWSFINNTNGDTVSDFNILRPDAQFVFGDILSAHGATLAEWQGMGRDTHSLLSATGKVDIGQYAVLHAFDANSAQALVGFGFDGGKWDGVGIISSNAASSTTGLLGVGVLLNNNGSGTPYFASSGSSVNGSFFGQTTITTDVLVRTTNYGDANLDGVVNGTDYSFTDGGFNNHLTGWVNGDFNYDRAVDGTDYSYIDAGFNNQATGTPSSIIATESKSVQPTSINESTSLSNWFANSQTNFRKLVDQTDEVMNLLN